MKYFVALYSVSMRDDDDDVCRFVSSEVSDEIYDNISGDFQTFQVSMQIISILLLFQRLTIAVISRPNSV